MTAHSDGTPDSPADPGLLFSLVQEELRKLARSLRAARGTDPVLQTTLLVNEAFLRLTNGPTAAWQNEKHFLSLAYGTMKRILASHLRRRRPGQLPDRADVADPRTRLHYAESGELLDAFAVAFGRLDAADPSAAAAFSLCFFHSLDVPNRADLMAAVRGYTGDHLSMRDAAAVLGTSAAGVCRAVDRATAFLGRALRGHAD